MDRNKIDCWYEGKYPLFDISEAGMIGSPVVLKEIEKYKPAFHRFFEYEKSQGFDALVSVLSKKYSCSLKNILVTNGASESLFLLLMVLCENASVVSCQFPYYSTNLESVCRKVGVSLNYCNFFDQNFHFDISSFKNHIRKKKSDVIIINSPNNPTATELSLDDYHNIIGSVTSKQFIICDEATYVSQTPSFLERNVSNHFHNLILISGMAKAFGVPGIRIGWIVADEMIIRSCLTLKESISVCSSPIMQDVAAILLEKSDFILAEHRNIIDNNWKILVETINTTCLPFMTVNPPHSTAFCMLKYYGDISEYQYCFDIYQNTGVLLTPGSCFSLPGYIRVGLGINCDAFSNGLSSLCSYQK